MGIYRLSFLNIDKRGSGGIPYCCHPRERHDASRGEHHADGRYLFPRPTNRRENLPEEKIFFPPFRSSRLATFPPQSCGDHIQDLLDTQAHRSSISPVNFDQQIGLAQLPENTYLLDSRHSLYLLMTSLASLSSCERSSPRFYMHFHLLRRLSFLRRCLHVLGDRDRGIGEEPGDFSRPISPSSSSFIPPSSTHCKDAAHQNIQN